MSCTLQISYAGRLHRFVVVIVLPGGLPRKRPHHSSEYRDSDFQEALSTSL